MEREKTRLLLVPPELTDGQHTSIHGLDHDPAVLGHLLIDWARETEPGETATFGIIDMTEEEIDALPGM